jgi:lipocalin-like protein
MSAEQLIGNWKLVSWQVVTGDEAKDLFGTKPKGYMILTREGRAMTVTAAEGRAPGESEPERAALHKSMLAYTGKYRIEGNEFITTVDASWKRGLERLRAEAAFQARRRQAFHRVGTGPEHSVSRQG